MPTPMPRAAVVHKAAAVVKPPIWDFLRIIKPEPRKPIPIATAWITLPGENEAWETISALKAVIVKKQEPKATKAKVRKPASLPLSLLSKPSKAPKNAASSNCKNG